MPHIVGVKMPLPGNGDFAGELVNLRFQTPDDFAIGYSGDWGAKDSLLAGGDAWFSVVAGLLPVPALRLTRAAASGDTQKATQLNEAFSPLWALFKAFGSFRVMYALANLLDGSRIEPMPPVQPLASDVRLKVQAALDALHETIASLE